MVTVSHDWDTEEYVETLETAWSEYRRACYGDGPLNPTQEQETKQAFLSGIAWLSARDSYCHEDIERAVREIVGRWNPHLMKDGGK